MRGERCRWVRGGLLVCCAAVAGCRTYVIQGVVVEGPAGDMTFVAPDDPRLSEPGLSNVRVSVHRDPDKLSRHLAGTDLTDTRGRFSVPVEGFGAGWMDEVWLIKAFKPGFETAMSREKLDMSRTDRRLLIMLAPGVSTPQGPDLWEQYEKYR